MMIALCGCMMQEPEVVEKLKKSYRFVDIIFGTHNIYKFAELIVSRMNSGKMVIDIWKDKMGIRDSYLAEPAADLLAVTFTAILFTVRFKKALQTMENKKIQDT